MTMAATCEECRRGFDPPTGGICARCGRLLCARHLRGWRPAFLALFARARPVCVSCRGSGGAQARDPGRAGPA